MSGPDWPLGWHLDPRKVSHYLLDDAHKEGGPKARFLRRFGFRDDAPYVLASALLLHPHPDILAGRTISERGDVKPIFEGPLASPDGRNPSIRTVWRIGSGTEALMCRTASASGRSAARGRAVTMCASLSDARPSCTGSSPK